MIIGTSYFVSFQHAKRYYSDYEPSDGSETTMHAYINSKLRQGEIHIGKPLHLLKPGEKLVLLDNNRRYGIETA